MTMPLKLSIALKKPTRQLSAARSRRHPLPSRSSPLYARTASRSTPRSKAETWVESNNVSAHMGVKMGGGEPPIFILRRSRFSRLQRNVCSYRKHRTAKNDLKDQSKGEWL